MIQLDTQTFEASDGLRITYYTTPQNKKTRGVVIIVHGMAEHAKRYRELADFLYRRNYIIYALDQRGHGQTGLDADALGYFADHDGWERIVSDVEELTHIARKEHDELPLFLMGHSMGSVVVRTCLEKFGALYKAGIMCGSTLGINVAVHQVGKFIAQMEMEKFGAKHPSARLTAMSFGSYNQHFKPNRTAFDWLSANAENVDSYIADPLCGFTCTAGFYYDFFTGLDYANRFDHLAQIPHDLPILYIAGACDPVSNMGKEVQTLYHRTLNAGVENVNLILYPGKRHEILGESNRTEVFNDLTLFIDNYC